MNLPNRIAASVCVTCLASSVAIAQERVLQPQRNQPAQVEVQAGPPGQQQNVQVQANAPGHHQHMTNDQILANCIAIANQTEVAIAKEAENKAQSKEVKDFAAMLVKDHQEFLHKLSKFAPDATREGYLNETADAQGRHRTLNQERREERREERQTNAERRDKPGVEVNEGNVQVRANPPEAGTDGRRLDMVQLHREIAQECVNSAKNEMSKKSGNEVDKCFVGFQIAAHAGMKDKLTVFQRHTSGELAQTISEGLQTTERHMKKAEEIMKNLHKSNDQRVTSNTRD